MKSMKRFNLFFIFALVLVYSVGCSTNKLKNKSAKKIRTEELKLSNFDQVNIPKESIAIAKMIEIVQPELDGKFRVDFANIIESASKHYHIEPQIIVALIDTESNFKAEKVSTTGDLSIAQVNVDVWNKEFERMKLPLIKKHKLTNKDQTYAVFTMAQILSILKKRHLKHDRRWYARYHSNTTKYKHEYLKRIEVRMKLLNQDLGYILAKNSRRGPYENI
jgi:hypothetical protein